VALFSRGNYEGSLSGQVMPPSLFKEDGQAYLSGVDPTRRVAR
jgi:hypothetical protein